ncbi:MAG: prolyl oligopeptidase family serine peptidase, partial [Bacteroidales bacterium]|nr:prolyl oligopeptidase family serine peptidase [Bacteroidales bacterium]
MDIYKLKVGRTITIILNLLAIHFSVFSQQTLNKSIIHDGIQREYILYVPATYNGNSATSIVLNFHGYGSSAAQQMWYGDFRPIADTADFLIVHPQGSLFNGISHWNVGGWTIGSTVDDIGFVEALIDSVGADYNIDSTRIYATGMSNGGFMSFLLASQLSEKIAAIASVAGSMTPETYNNSNPSHPTPILQFHGTADGVVPYNGAIWTLS